MPDPTIRGFGGTNSGVNVTQTDVDIVARSGVTPRVGDITLIAIVKDGTGAFTWPSGWTSLSGLPVTFASTNNQGVLDVRYRKCVADGEATIISITHASEGTAHQVYVIDGTGALEGLPEGAAATGDSTNPDPPNLAPSWGGRTNTLWIVFACNDGNTAITAAPTNYTNFQNDRWANTNGVGIATGRRTTNGSSENPGVFTMATEQWGAVTVGFNPGIVLTEPLNREGIEYSERIAKPYDRSYLTQIDNLINNTLAPIPQIPTPSVDFPNPQRKEGLLVTIVTKLQDDYNIAIVPPEWPIPQKGKELRLTWINNNLEDVLAPSPNNFNQYDWPNPILAKRHTLTHVFYPQLETPSQIPFVPIDYPNPLIGKRNKIGFEQTRPQYYQDIQPFNQEDWPNPGPRKLKSDTWIQNLLQGTLKPADVVAPFSIAEFNLPDRKGRLIVHISSSIVIAPPDQPPFVNEVTLQLPKAKRFIPVWYQSRPFYYSDIKPFKQDDWFMPQSKKIGAGFIFNRKLDEPTTQDPFVPVLFENPKIKVKINPDWTFLAPFQQIFIHPVGNSIFEVPAKLKRSIDQWIQPRPTYYNESTTNPFFGYSNIIPPRSLFKFKDVQTRFQLIQVNLGNPFSQNSWPNPSIKGRPNLGWEFYYQQDDNNPASINLTNLPPYHKTRNAVGWIYGRQVVQTTGNPFVGLQYPAQIIIGKTAITLINSLLPQLFPGVGATPFAQYEWPNPLKGKSNFHQGIQEGRKFFFEETIPQNRQNEWPIFRPIRRNQVGFIDFKIQSSIPKFTSITENSILKNKTALTWLYNSLIDLTFTPGINPFIPTIWPALNRKKSIIIDLINRGYIIPIIVGRNICLLADDTDYDLEATVEEFDLEAFIKEFGLEAGGTECE